MEQTLDAEYWSKRYKNDDAVWDVGEVSAPLKKYIDGLQDKSVAILIPGCGNAYEAEYLLQRGFSNITLIDFSPVLVKVIEQKFQAHLDKELTVICGDFFDLSSTFDLILEQTFLSALHPSLRNKYADKMYDLLNEHGLVAGVIFNKTFEGGPPFGGMQEEYQKLFAPLFLIETMEPCYNSIAPRKDSELFIRLRKK